MPPFGREPDRPPPERLAVPQAVPEPPIPIRASVTHSISARLGLAMLALIVAALLSPLWLQPLIDQPRHTLRYTNGPPDQPFPVLNKAAIRPGEVIQMRVSACNTSETPLGVKVSRTMVPEEGDSPSYFLPDVTGSWQPGCSTVISQAHKVPEGTRPGRYYLAGKTVPDDGSVAVIWHSETFAVVR